MNATKTTSRLKVKAGIKAGGLTHNHNRSMIRVKSGLRGGAEFYGKNHSARLLSVS